MPSRDFEIRIHRPHLLCIPPELVRFLRGFLSSGDGSTRSRCLARTDVFKRLDSTMTIRIVFFDRNDVLDETFDACRPEPIHPEQDETTKHFTDTYGWIAVFSRQGYRIVRVVRICESDFPSDSRKEAVRSQGAPTSRIHMRDLGLANHWGNQRRGEHWRAGVP